MNSHHNSVSTKILFVLFVILLFSACDIAKKTWTGVKNANLFTIEDDINLGNQVKSEIESNPEEFPILDRSKNALVYNYVNGLVDEILHSGKIKYKDEFAWEIQIIDKPEVQNAFATPGGYIYVFTGLIQFLDTGDQLAGVIGHEMAHADLRHSTRQLTDRYGVAFVSQLLLGGKEMAQQATDILFTLSFSRGHETEADAQSVVYLCDTKYKADGAAAFFEKIADQPVPPVFLSTHPNPRNRIEHIKERAQELDCSGHFDDRYNYQKMKNSIVSDASSRASGATEGKAINPIKNPKKNKGN